MLYNSYNRATLGKIITIYYNPENPSQIKGNSKTLGLFVSVIGLLAVMVAPIVIIKGPDKRAFNEPGGRRWWLIIDKFHIFTIILIEQIPLPVIGGGICFFDLINQPEWVHEKI